MERAELCPLQPRSVVLVVTDLVWWRPEPGDVPRRVRKIFRRRSQRWKVGEPACRPGSVPPLARGGGHPSGTAVADSLVRSTREHRAGRPQSPAQGAVGSPLDLAPGGVYRAAAVTCGAGGLLHHRFSLTPRRGDAATRGGLFSVALSRGSPRVGVTDHPALWSPDLPHRAAGPARPPGRLTRQIGYADREPRRMLTGCPTLIRRGSKPHCLA